MNPNCLKKIECFDWNALSCMDRSILYAVEDLKENAAVLIILLRYHFSDYLKKWKNIGKSDYLFYKNLLSSIGVDIELLSCAQSDLGRVVCEELDRENRIVCVVDNYYQKGCNYYLTAHHPHFICLLDYSSGFFKAFDEDYTGEFWLKENYLNGIRYISKDITIDTLKALSDTSNLFNGRYDNMLYKISMKPCNLDVVSIACDLYFKQVKYMLDNEEDELSFLLEKIKTFESSQKDFHNMYCNIFLKNDDSTVDEAKEKLKKLIKYPGNWCYAESRMKHISSQLHFFEVCRYESHPTNAFTERLRIIMRLYRDLELQIARCVMSGLVEDLQKAMCLFNTIYKQEIEAYRSVVVQYEYFREAIYVFCQ